MSEKTRDEIRHEISAKQWKQLCNAHGARYTHGYDGEGWNTSIRFDKEYNPWLVVGSLYHVSDESWLQGTSIAMARLEPKWLASCLLAIMHSRRNNAKYWMNVFKKQLRNGGITLETDKKTFNQGWY